MEAEYEKQMERLKDELNKEKEKKQALDRQLEQVKNDLENIEERFPQEVIELKDQIEQAKQQTNEYEKKTKELQ